MQYLQAPEIEENRQKSAVKEQKQAMGMILTLLALTSVVFTIYLIFWYHFPTLYAFLLQ